MTSSTKVLITVLTIFVKFKLILKSKKLSIIKYDLNSYTFFLLALRGIVVNCNRLFLSKDVAPFLLEEILFFGALKI